MKTPVSVFLAVFAGLLLTMTGPGTVSAQQLTAVQNYGINRPGVVMVSTVFSADVYVNKIQLDSRHFNHLVDSIRKVDSSGVIYTAEQKLDIVLKEINIHPNRFFEASLDYIKEPQEITSSGTGFLVTEMALSLVLLAGAGLLVKSFLRLASVEPGFRPDHLLTFQLELPSSKYLADGKYQEARVEEYFQQVFDRLERLPDVESAQVVSGRLSVEGVDASAALIDLCRARMPEQTWIVGDMREVALGRRFDGLIAWHSFFHLPWDDQRRMFDVFATHATPTAALMFTSGPAHGEAVGRFEGEALYHASLAPDEYRALLADAGFEVVDHVAEDPTSNGDTVWLARRSG